MEVRYGQINGVVKQCRYSFHPSFLVQVKKVSGKGLLSGKIQLLMAKKQ